MKVMLFAAGLGTRLQPFTLTAPKALYPINGIPLLERNITYLKSFGFQNFVINVHHFADQIIEFLKINNNFEVQIQISDESDELLETGGGLLKAQQLLGENPFLVMNADILTDMNMSDFVKFHFEKNPLVSLAVSNRTSTRKLLFDKNFGLCGWKDLRDGESIIQNEDYQHEMAFSGIHIIHPDFFDLNTFHGKFSIMKPYMHLMSQHPIVGYDHTGSKLIDVGKPESVVLAEKWFD
ncbi:MAG: nucleotidyltransferase family protein [Flavobacteriaceae bacterium]|nr:nucleotidyltransferase family protein [Flavobacteriaceae bacterium]